VRRSVLALTVAGILGGCAPPASPPLYYWGDYESSIHVRYTESDTAAAQAYLEKVIAGSQAGNGRVPPGVYADYGLLLYQQGRGAEAVAYFRKEADAFPESEPLMTKLIARVGDGSAPAAVAASRPAAPSDASSAAPSSAPAGM